MKLPAEDPRARPDLDPNLETNGEPIPFPELEKKQEDELLLIRHLADQLEEPRQAPPPLIKVPDLIITPDRDARYHPPSSRRCPRHWSWSLTQTTKRSVPVDCSPDCGTQLSRTSRMVRRVTSGTQRARDS